jgi:hypothetical protein
VKHGEHIWPDTDVDRLAWPRINAHQQDVEWRDLFVLQTCGNGCALTKIADIGGAIPNSTEDPAAIPAPPIRSCHGVTGGLSVDLDIRERWIGIRLVGGARFSREGGV